MKKLALIFFTLTVIFTFSCKKEKVDSQPNKLLNMVNEYRRTGCRCGDTDMQPVDDLKWNTVLEKVAIEHSIDMSENNSFSHTGSNGSSHDDRIRAAGYKPISSGENIANGYTAEKAVIEGWINSPGHCRNIMSNNYTEMGIGREGNYWTQVFAKPQANK